MKLNEASITAGKILEQNFLPEKSGVRTTVTEIYRTKQDIERVIQYIERNPHYFQYSQQQEKKLPYIFLKGNGVHSEMVITNHLIENKRLEELKKEQTLQIHENKEPSAIYIGDSKLCCGFCKIAIDVVNESNTDSKIKTGGTHAKFYTWPIPQFILDNKDLKIALFNKLKEYRKMEPKCERRPDNRELTPPFSNNQFLIESNIPKSDKTDKKWAHYEINKLLQTKCDKNINIYTGCSSAKLLKLYLEDVRKSRNPIHIILLRVNSKNNAFAESNAGQYVGLCVMKQKDETKIIYLDPKGKSINDQISKEITQSFNQNCFIVEALKDKAIQLPTVTFNILDQGNEYNGPFVTYLLAIAANKKLDSLPTKSLNEKQSKEFGEYLRENLMQATPLNQLILQHKELILKDKHLKRTEKLSHENPLNVNKKWYGNNKMRNLLEKYVKSNKCDTGAIIGSKDMLEDACEGLKRDNYDQHVFPLHVNVITGGFHTEENSANHWVGIRVMGGIGGRVIINYVDPMGNPISEEIKNILENKFKNCQIIERFNDKNKIQYSDIESRGKFQFLTENSNQNDCGPFVIYALNALCNEQIISQVENYEESIKLGQILRQALGSEKKVDLSEFIYKNKHLKRTEKSSLEIYGAENSEKSEGYNLSKIFNAQNFNSELLNKIDKRAIIEADLGYKSIDIMPRKEIDKKTQEQVQIIGEQNHLTDHPKNVQSLIEDIKNGNIGSDTVIGLERKQYGDNLGMKDVIKLSMIMEHNEKNLFSKILIPKEITESLIYQDALLYKTAKEQGVKVIGLEGKGLEHLKNSPNYDKNREQYMADVIKEVTGKGYKFIANVGEAHVKNIEQRVDSPQNINIENLSKLPKKIISKVDEIKNSLKENIIEIKSNTPPRNLLQKPLSSTKNSKTQSRY